MPTLTGLADVPRSLGTKELMSLERTVSAVPVVNDEGAAVRGPVTTSNFGPKTVHPISGRDRNLLPEGVRTAETFVTYATQRLRTETEAGPAADVLIRTPTGGTKSRFIVQTAEDWNDVSGHFRIFATREPTG